MLEKYLQESELPKNEEELWQFLLGYADRQFPGTEAPILLKSLHAMSKLDKLPDEEFGKLEEELFNHLRQYGNPADHINWFYPLGACRSATIIRRRYIWTRDMLVKDKIKIGKLELRHLKAFSGTTFASEEEVDHFIAQLEEHLSFAEVEITEIVDKDELEWLRAEAKKRTRKRLGRK